MKRGRIEGLLQNIFNKRRESDMKKITTLGVTAVLAVGLAGCTPGDNIPGATLAGTAAGGLLGAALFQGSGAWIGVLGGALVGGVIGNFVGKRMDERDQMNMANA